MKNYSLFSKGFCKLSKTNNIKHFSAVSNLLPRVLGLKEAYTKRQLNNEISNDPLLGKIRRKEPVRVTVTGPAGAIGYALVFRLANGELLGPDQPIILNLLELPQALNALKGVEMELRDCAFPNLEEINITDEPEEAFDGSEIALMVGSKPRGPGMARGDLLRENGEIFQKLGQVINKQASTNCRVTVVGNPCNTNCLILANNAPDIPIKNFTAMTRLDHDRCVSIIQRKTQLPANEINNVAIWGNHSESMFVDTRCITVHGQPFEEAMGAMRCSRYVRNELIPKVQQRGKRIIDVRGSSSAASAASACLAHTRDWCLGTVLPDWVSMGVVSSGQYAVPKGLVFSYPTFCEKGGYRVVSYPYEFDSHQQYLMQTNIDELEQERDMVSSYLPN